jgi:hypothetical protein
LSRHHNLFSNQEEKTGCPELPVFFFVRKLVLESDGLLSNGYFIQLNRNIDFLK